MGLLGDVSIGSETILVKENDIQTNKRVPDCTKYDAVSSEPHTPVTHFGLCGYDDASSDLYNYVYICLFVYRCSLSNVI